MVTRPPWSESRQARAQTIAAVAKEIFLPLTVGGGIRNEADAAAAIEAGADKVSLNTAALDNPQLITTLANRYGSQAVIVAIERVEHERGCAWSPRTNVQMSPCRGSERPSQEQ